MTETRPGPATARGASNGPERPAISPTPQPTIAAAVPGEPLSVDICVIGAGAGGLAVAQAAAAFGRRVALIEKHRMGGASLNTGCLPSQALLASARRAQAMRTAAAFGIAAVDPQIDPRAVQAHVKGVISAAAPSSSVERHTGLGISVILGAGRFLDKRTVLAGDYRIAARRFVIATGSSPVVPEIPGLDGCPFFTTDTIVESDRKIASLVVIGGGAAALELAQAHARLGSRVTVVEADRALAGEDPELAAAVMKRLRAEGVEILEGTKIERVETIAGLPRAHVTSPDGLGTIDGTHLLIASGRRANISDLNLPAAGIKTGPHGILVNRGQRTTNRRVYAVGDVTGAPQATHASTYQAAIVLSRALFLSSAKTDPAIIPHVTFTDPELARVGLSEDQARAGKHTIHVLRSSFVENDRAQAERATEGHIKVVITDKGRILGASIVGASAGELIQVWALALSQGLDIKAMAGAVAAYPTLSEISKRAALGSVAAAAASRSVRKLIDFVARLG
jgi:pyruvate/2-oxoglutarate dehydrogenase complex dihydrolipoamide dehydrogenase (E3) component